MCIDNMINDKNTEKILEKHHKDVKRYMDVLTERFGDKVNLIAEQYDSIKNELVSHREIIGSIKEDIEIVKIDTAFIKGSLKQKVDLDEFSALERRVILIETKLAKR